MRPQNLKTKIFIDSGDPKETQAAINQLGFLDGQTTNPTLIAKHPEAKARLERGEKFTSDEIYAFYKEVVQELSQMMPTGSISIEVYADVNTTAHTMLAQGKEMFTWIPNAHIKFPTTTAGLEATEKAVKEGLRVNLTLCFSQAQAAAVYAATRGAKKGDVFVSPFVGRLDDIGANGMDLIVNTMKMYAAGDGHVEVLTASVRNMNHFLYALQLDSDLITTPFKLLQEWAGQDMKTPGVEFAYSVGDLKPMPYQEFDLNKDWHTFDIHHDLTDKGIERFSQDWNALIK